MLARHGSRGLCGASMCLRGLHSVNLAAPLGARLADSALPLRWSGTANGPQMLFSPVPDNPAPALVLQPLPQYGTQLRWFCTSPRGTDPAGAKPPPVSPPPPPPLRAQQEQQGAAQDGDKVVAVEEEEEEEKEGKKKPSLGARMKVMWARYGYVTISMYLGIYGVTLASLFYGYDSQLIVPMEMLNDPAAASAKLASVLEFVRVVPDEAIDWVRTTPRAGTFAIAWVTTKFTEPARALFTIWAVPKIARRLGMAPKLEKGHRKRQLQKLMGKQRKKPGE